MMFSENRHVAGLSRFLRCNGSEAGSYLRLIYFCITQPYELVGLRAIKKREEEMYSAAENRALEDGDFARKEGKGWYEASYRANPKTQTPNPKTRKPKPQTPNPKP